MYISLDHTTAMHICGSITAGRDTSTAFELFTQRQLRLSHYTKEAIPVDFFQSCLGNLHPFFSASLFLLSLFRLSVIHLTALLIKPTQTQSSCGRHMHKHTHHTLISLCRLDWIELSGTGVRSFNILPAPWGSCLCLLSPE